MIMTQEANDGSQQMRYMLCVQPLIQHHQEVLRYSGATWCVCAGWTAEVSFVLLLAGLDFTGQGCVFVSAGLSSSRLSCCLNRFGLVA